MDPYAGLETPGDIELIKQFALIPILLDMLIRDIEELAIYNNKLVYFHLIHYVRELATALQRELQKIKIAMKQQKMLIVRQELNAQGIYIEYKVRGYTHRFEMLRSRIKVELMILLQNVRRGRHYE